MSKGKHTTHELDDFLRYAEKVIVEDGNTYYRFPQWFQSTTDGLIALSDDEFPEELSMFICKAGLGSYNPQIIKPEI